MDDDFDADDSTKKIKPSVMYMIDFAQGSEIVAG
jgi:hypothetical protein